MRCPLGAKYVQLAQAKQGNKGDEVMKRQTIHRFYFFASVKRFILSLLLL
jgi:hypothetical protein